VNIICADKTGTLTEGKMSVTNIVTPNNNIPYHDLVLLKAKNPGKYNDIVDVLKIATLSNDGVEQKKETLLHKTENMAL